MIIELPGSTADYHTGTVKQYRMGFFHFSNNNLSIRRGCAEDLGKYDPEVLRSEDVDICFRVAQHPSWVALREPGNVLRHKARKSFKAFVRQMWGWGTFVGWPYRKTGIKGLHLYWVSSSKHEITFDIEIERFPFLVCMFWTDFHVFHLLLTLGGALALLGAGWLGAASALVSLVFFWRSLHDDRMAAREMDMSLGETVHLAALHYTANVVFGISAIWGALKCRMVLLPAAIFRPTPPPDTLVRAEPAAVPNPRGAVALAS